MSYSGSGAAYTQGCAATTTFFFSAVVGFPGRNEASGPRPLVAVTAAVANFKKLLRDGDPVPLLACTPSTLLMGAPFFAARV